MQYHSISYHRHNTIFISHTTNINNTDTAYPCNCTQLYTFNDLVVWIICKLLNRTPNHIMVLIKKLEPSFLTLCFYHHGRYIDNWRIWCKYYVLASIHDYIDLNGSYAIDWIISYDAHKCTTSIWRYKCIFLAASSYIIQN